MFGASPPVMPGDQRGRDVEMTPLALFSAIILSGMMSSQQDQFDVPDNKARKAMEHAKALLQQLRNVY